jgi:hypothetical protein
MGELGEVADLDAFRRGEGEDIGVRWADVAEARDVECGVDSLGPMLVDETQQQAERRIFRNRLFQDRQVPD